MTHDEMEELARQVAYELTELRGEGWSLARMGRPDDTWPVAWLLGEDRAMLRLLLVGSAGKVNVSGEFPGNAGALMRYQCNVNPDRGAAVLARAANRLVLEAGYLDALPGVLKRHQEYEAKRQRQAELLSQAAELLGTRPADPGDGRRVFLTGDVHGYVEVRTGDPATVSFSISGIPAQTALEMLAVLARDTRKATESMSH